MYPNLTVYDGPMDVEIYDPNTNKIKQWLQLRDLSGVITNVMLMYTQPVLGDWQSKVISHGRSEEKVFTVAHYVLPRFEVSVELPSFVLTSDTSVQETVKATYTYGKPVTGTVKLRAKLDYFYHAWNYHSSEPMVELSLNIRVARQDDTPMTGTRPPVVIQTTVTYELPEPSPTPKYYYRPRT